MSEQPGYVAPAAWYVDPSTSAHLRWWSGLEWTQHVAPLPEVVAAPGPSRRDQRDQRDRRSTVEAAPPPPPTPLIAPVTSFDWSTETEKAGAPRARVTERVDEYRFVPSRWGTVSVWLIAFDPWLAVVFVVATALFIPVAVVESSTNAVFAVYALPYLCVLFCALRDYARLRAFGHRHVAHWAWALLGELAYLIARTVVLRRHTGIGSPPLWVYLVNMVVAFLSLLLIVFAVMPMILVLQ